LELAQAGRATLILSVESAAYFYPDTPEQVVNACYSAGFRTVHRGVLGDELVAREYLQLWSEDGWGTMIRSTCPVVVETIEHEYPELIPYLAPVASPWTTSTSGSWTSCRARGASTTRCSGRASSCSGGARSWGPRSPFARGSRSSTPMSRTAYRWRRRSRSRATGCGPRPRRSRP